ncbi:hypothetical protein [Stenotrophomonas phage RAS14]
MITEQTEYTLPSNPKDREKIKRQIEDIVNQMHMKAAIDATIKEKEASMKEELGVPPKITKRLAKVLFKEQVDGNEFDKQVAEHETFSDTFEILFRGAPGPVEQEDLERDEDADDQDDDNAPF